MKKIIWIISIIPLMITAFAISILPDEVPMHYDINGSVDRWGSKYENLIFPVLIIAMAAFWFFMIRFFEKKGKTAKEDKDRAQAESNVKVMNIVAVVNLLMFTAMQCYFLYGEYNVAKNDLTEFDVGRVSCILIGLFMVVAGNYMPKTNKNSTIGVRMSWSMYNDVTWKKSNRFGGIIMMIIGLATILTGCILASSVTAMIFMTGYLVVGIIVISVYAHGVYAKEADNAGSGDK